MVKTQDMSALCRALDQTRAMTPGYVSPESIVRDLVG
jgi:hypothetical protein